MPRNSGPTNRNVVNHQAGKGDASRVTNVKAYRDNFSEIDWKPRHRMALIPGDRIIPIIFVKENPSTSR